MKIITLLCKDFRCFSESLFAFHSSLIVIEGYNGSGKSSLLEALTYGCYFKSPRTSTVKDLIAFDHEAFYVEIHGSTDEQNWKLSLGFSGKQRRIKLNDIPLKTYKELMPLYKVIHISEEDFDIIKGSPEARRTFIDTALCIYDPQYVILLKQYKKILEQRNAFLHSSFNRSDKDSHAIWTQRLWILSQEIQHKRIYFLLLLQQAIESVWKSHYASLFGEKSPFSYEYISKRCSLETSYEDLLSNDSLFHQEWSVGHSLFGAHTDDIIFHFNAHASRFFASRGQQKLFIFLIKYALFILVGKKSIILIDDFLTDFDPRFLPVIISMLVSSQTQVFITTPSLTYDLKHLLENFTYQKISL